jgi:superfamily II DNA or RNA helicase
MAKTKNEIQSEALSTIKPLRKAGLGISMGVGKTRICLDHFRLVQKLIRKKYDRDAKALIVAPKKVILENWKAEAIKWGMEDLINKMVFTTYISLIKQDLDYDIVYLDECHSLLYSHEAWLKEFNGNIIGVTGTPPKREKSEKGKMVSRYCPIVYEYFVDEAVNDNILNEYSITVHLLELDNANTILIEKGSRKWYTSEIKNYNYWSDRISNSNTPKERQITSVQRMKAMQTFPSKDDYAKRLLNQSKHKCLLFANTQNQADKLCKYSYHSNNVNSEDNMLLFKNGQITKMSCVLQLNEGANIPNLKEGIIMHAYGNNRKSAQRIGRLLRLNPNDTANIHILCYKDTVDLKWVKSALEDLDQNKISWYDPDVF